MNAIGINLTSPYTAAERLQGVSHALGDLYTHRNGNIYQLVSTAAAVAANDVVFYGRDYAAAALSTSNDARGVSIGVAPYAFAAGDWGWVQVFGAASANVLASAAANARLNTTATAGALDDDGTTGAMQVQGLYLTTANGGATAAAPCILRFPFIDVTL